jgi:hypothetical protein
MNKYYKMLPLDYNIYLNSIKILITTLVKSKYINNYIFLFLLIAILSFIIFIIVSYYVVRFLKTSIDQYNLFFYQYNKDSQNILDKYGNSKIYKIHIIRQPFNKYINFILNLLTGFQYNTKLAESKEYFPYHVFLMFEIKKGKKRKFILVEKNNYVNICDTFFMRDIQEILPIKIKKNKYTLKSILSSTQKRMGIQSFFNWNPYKNNCHEFTKEMLITINKYNDYYKEFIFRDKMLQLIIPSDFTLHIAYSMSFIHNLFTKYILDNDLFNHYSAL